MQSSVLGIPMLRWLKQTPPHTNKWTLVLWSAAAGIGCIPLLVISFGTKLFYAPTPRATASGSFFASLFCLVFPMQVSNLIGSFVYQHFVDRTRVATSSGLNTAMQATGRGVGVLASGIIFALASGNDGDDGNPVPGFGGSIAMTCAVMLSASAIAALSYKDYGEGGLNCGPCFSLQQQQRKKDGLVATSSGKSPADAPPLAPRPGSAVKGTGAGPADLSASAAAAAAKADAAASEAVDVERAGVSK